ncbi:MAG: DEAD/DEAH box helicase family protein [Bradymonadia bacterium]
MCEIGFRAGTLLVKRCEALQGDLPYLIWDERVSCHRAKASDYARLVMEHVRNGLPYNDQARAYLQIGSSLVATRTPRSYQRAALDSWTRNRSQGVIVLPTGAGKTQVALMAMDRVQRSCLVVVPTLDLVRQWRRRISEDFGCAVGQVGGGTHEIAPITVTTYDSAYIHMEHLGDKFGLIIFDECHHLPSGAYRLASESSLAPFRLGLTATPERTDGGEALYGELIGPIVYREEIGNLAGEYLADYDTEQIAVKLTEQERGLYEEERAIYREFVTTRGIRLGGGNGWQRFISETARSKAGRRAMQAYQKQRQLAYAAPSKLDYLNTLIARHADAQMLIFTQDNQTVYEISRRFLVPAITHQTKLKERTEYLDGFGRGEYRIIVTSKVLNEGVDVPNASVAVVLSGSGSIREHVQRLGRILRPYAGKRAILYELIAENTVEQYTSQRRRAHNAYQ